MSGQGYIYILINPSMEGLVKIGKTQRNPDDRVKELSIATGVPTPFILAFDSFFENCSQAEEYIHALLEQHRVSNSREFFVVPLNEAIKIVIDAKTALSSSKELCTEGTDTGADWESAYLQSHHGATIENYFEPISLPHKEPWHEIFQLAEQCYYGRGDTIQDYVEAFRLYRQAARLGSPDAYYQLGVMCSGGEGCTVNEQEALKYLKEGAKRGNSRCYAEMASLFMKNNHIENSLKCWKKYFESNNFSKMSMSHKVNHVIHGIKYLRAMHHLALPFTYHDELMGIKNEMLETVNTQLNLATEKDDFNDWLFWEELLGLIDPEKKKIPDNIYLMFYYNAVNFIMNANGEYIQHLRFLDGVKINEENWKIIGFTKSMESYIPYITVRQAFENPDLINGCIVIERRSLTGQPKLWVPSKPDQTVKFPKIWTNNT